MAKKSTSASKTSSKSAAPLRAIAPPAAAKSAAKSAPPRNVTHEMIAKRAYEIFASGKGGSADENWRRAEAELRK